MVVVVTGNAEIALPGDVRVTLGGSDIAFQHIATLNTTDGPEQTYEAVWFLEGQEKGPGVAWMVWENPVGVLNDFSSEPLNGAKIISDFEFDIELDRED